MGDVFIYFAGGGFSEELGTVCPGGSRFYTAAIAPVTISTQSNPPYDALPVTLLLTGKSATTGLPVSYLHKFDAKLAGGK